MSANASVAGVIGARVGVSSPRHRSVAEDKYHRFVRSFDAVQRSRGTVSDYLEAARQISWEGQAEWRRAWFDIAAESRIHGDEALRRGAVKTAGLAILRASAYYRLSEMFADENDVWRRESITNMEDCSRHFLRSFQAGGEIVELPFEGSRGSAAYFLHAVGLKRRNPALICFGVGETYKDELLHAMAMHAFNTGLSLFLVRVPEGQSAACSRKSGRFNLEGFVSSCFDYLGTRADVDADRIALCGDESTGAYASRVASVDRRFAAVVCEGGLWADEVHQLSRDWGLEKNSAALSVDKSIGRRGHRICCPMLIADGEGDYIEVRKSAAAGKSSGPAALVEGWERGSYDGTNFRCEVERGLRKRAFVCGWIGEVMTVGVNARMKTSSKTF